MKVKEFDEKFDNGEDITEYLEVSKAKRPKHDQKRVNNKRVASPLGEKYGFWLRKTNQSHDNGYKNAVYVDGGVYD